MFAFSYTLTEEGQANRVPPRDSDVLVFRVYSEHEALGLAVAISLDLIFQKQLSFYFHFLHCPFAPIYSSSSNPLCFPILSRGHFSIHFRSSAPVKPISFLSTLNFPTTPLFLSHNNEVLSKL